MAEIVRVTHNEVRQTIDIRVTRSVTSDDLRYFLHPEGHWEEMQPGVEFPAAWSIPYYLMPEILASMGEIHSEPALREALQVERARVDKLLDAAMVKVVDNG